MYNNKSLLTNDWDIEKFDERSILYFSQKHNIPYLLAKLLLIRNITDDNVVNFLNPNIKNNLPNPFLLKDMTKAVDRITLAITKNENIGIISDYDVDGSTSATILYKFLNFFSNKLILKIPNRLTDGYGPNLKLMDEMLESNVKVLFTLDCGTSSFDIIDNSKYSKIDTIVIDHHLSENFLPNVFSVINPNRSDENSEFKEMAAVGVTFLFLMALRKNLRNKKFFNKNIIEPNLLSFLDLVALGTVCDVVKLVSYNRVFVKMGLELIKERKNKAITKILDNSNLQSTPTSNDLGFIIGPQLNAASRIDDSSLPSKLLITNNLSNIESISKKLFLLNEKRKLIENNVYEEALIQANKQTNQNYILVYGKSWHNGVLGIVASKLINKFNKPTIVISFTNAYGVGSARSIASINLGNIILNAKNQKLLITGGGHKMAAGLKIKYELLDSFTLFLKKNLESLPKKFFRKLEVFDSYISINEINNSLLQIIEQLEPFGAANPEPKFIIKHTKINSIKILKNKHLLIFFYNDLTSNLKGICFNCIDTELGDYLLNYKKYKFDIGCVIKRDYFNNTLTPQILIKDVMIIN